MNLNRIWLGSVWFGCRFLTEGKIPINKLKIKGDQRRQGRLGLIAKVKDELGKDDRPLPD